MNILFVCTGNISRSFLAEMLLKNKIRENNTSGIFVSSAGTHAYPGSEADTDMLNFLIEKNIPSEYHQSKMIEDSDIEWADSILVMESIHYDFITASWPEAESKIEKLGKYVAMDQTEDDIPDPYGKSPYHYRAAQSQITLAVSNLFRLISKNTS